jgi:hypothetical protein
MKNHTEKRTTDMTNEKKQKLIKLIGDLGWDYDRLSSSGQQVYNELCDLLGIQ